MTTITIEAPAMYADHHVIEVRRILLETPGVEEVYASSAFHAIEVTFDESQIDERQILAKLENAGYLGELDIPVETGAPAYGENGSEAYFRHTAAYEQTNQVVGFTQEIPYIGRPLWPCPGLGPIAKPQSEE